MEIITFIVLVVFSLVLAYLGFKLEPVNPYLILFSSMILFLVFASSITSDIKIPNGITEVNLDITPSNVTGTLIDQKESPNQWINASLKLIILLMSLYLAYFSIDEIIGEKYGRTRIK